METSLQPDSGSGVWAEQFAASLRSGRDRAGEVLAAQKARLERAKAMLEEEISRLVEQAQAAAPTGKGPQQRGTLDWEMEKRRILAVLARNAERLEGFRVCAYHGDRFRRGLWRGRPLSGIMMPTRRATPVAV